MASRNRPSAPKLSKTARPRVTFLPGLRRQPLGGRLFRSPANTASYVADRPLSIVSLDARINRIGRALECVGDLIGRPPSREHFAKLVFFSRCPSPRRWWF